MLPRDVLNLIFAHFNTIRAKMYRLVCVEWNLLLRVRFRVFHANHYLKTVPKYCDKLVCCVHKLPRLHPNIKRALVYYTNVTWDQYIETLLLYLNPGGIAKITNNIGNLVIGIFMHTYTYQDIFRYLDLDKLRDNLYDKGVILISYWALCLTSEAKYKASTGIKVIYIKPGTCIDNLTVGASYLQIVKLDANIKSFRVINNSKRGIKFTVCKDGITMEYDLSKFPNGVLDKSVYS